jgi:hypothetical protein
MEYFSLLNIMVASSKEGRTTTSKVIIATVIVLGLMGAVAVTVFIIQEAEARGCKHKHSTLQRDDASTQILFCLFS